MKKENLRKSLQLYAITDRRMICDSQNLEENADSKKQKECVAAAVEQAILGGVSMIQFREKELAYAEMKAHALEVMQVCRKYQIPLIINDYVRLAYEIGADGVHLGQKDCSIEEARKILGKDAVIGITAKTVEQAKEAQSKGADYLGSGAVFGSCTKPDAIPMKHELLQQICMSVSIPVVAIGGINQQNVTRLSERNMSGFAVIGGIFGQKDIKESANNFIGLIQKMNLM